MVMSSMSVGHPIFTVSSSPNIMVDSCWFNLCSYPKKQNWELLYIIKKPVELTDHHKSHGGKTAQPSNSKLHYKSRSKNLKTDPFLGQTTTNLPVVAPSPNDMAPPMAAPKIWLQKSSAPGQGSASPSPRKRSRRFPRFFGALMKPFVGLWKFTCCIVFHLVFRCLLDFF